MRESVTAVVLLTAAALCSSPHVSPPSRPHLPAPFPSPTPLLSSAAPTSPPRPLPLPPPPKVGKTPGAHAKTARAPTVGAPAVLQRLGLREVGLEAVDVSAKPAAEKRSTPPTASATSHLLLLLSRVDVPAEHEEVKHPGTPTQLASSSPIIELFLPVALQWSATGNSMNRIQVTKIGTPGLGTHTPKTSAR